MHDTDLHVDGDDMTWDSARTPFNVTPFPERAQVRFQLLEARIAELERRINDLEQQLTGPAPEGGIVTWTPRGSRL